MRISSQLKKIPHYIRENGFANFLVYLITTTLLTSVNWLLVPFKKKTDTDPFYRVFNRFITSVNEMPPGTSMPYSRYRCLSIWRCRGRR
ncbi:MAG: hypothetical protein AB2662_13330 [Candidatus Thiodiazotropha sp.]